MSPASLLAERMKIDISNLIVEGVVPSGVTCFAELHDYVDANCLGNSEKAVDGLDSEAMCKLMNDAIEIVNQWMVF